MHSVLIFSPMASPTYVPFGLASLFSYISHHHPGHQLGLLDLNLSLWRDLLKAHPDGDAYFSFIHNRTNCFYDPQAYLSIQPIRDQVQFQVNMLSQKAKRYVELEELNSNLEDLLEKQTAAIFKQNPTVIGFSLMFLDQLNFSLALAKYIRRQEASRSIRLVFGGASIMALQAEELLQACSYIDGMILGEGEHGLEALLLGKENDKVPGLLYRSDTGFRKNGKEGGRSGNLLPADFSGLDLDSYLNPETVVPLVFSRDCQWGKCRFCAHNFTFSGFRKRAVTSFVDEIELLNQQLGIRTFYFADQYISAENLEQIALEIVQRKLQITYHVMGRPEAAYTLQRLKTIALSGCRWISWGVESGSQRLLDLVKKGTTVAVIEEVLQHAATVGISNTAMMIFGLPTSSDIDLWQTFGLLDRIQEYIEVVRASAYVLYDRTYFAHRPDRYGLSVSGRQKLLQIGPNVVHSTKLGYRETSSDGSLRPPRGAIEVTEWEKRSTWMKPMDFFDKLPCEHYLLYASHQYEGRHAPVKPWTQSA